MSFLDVSKRFSLRVDGELHHVQALDRVSFTVGDGEIVVLIGPSGCGHDRGMVFQHAELLPWLSTMQNVMSPWKRHVVLEMKGMRGQPLRETVKKYPELVGLTDSQNRRPHQLSGGRLTGIETERGVIEADAFMLSLGAGSKTFARACSFDLPIYPVKGHSIMIRSGDVRRISHGVTDFSRKIVFAQL